MKKEEAEKLINDFVTQISYCAFSKVNHSLGIKNPEFYDENKGEILRKQIISALTAEWKDKPEIGEYKVSYYTRVVQGPHGLVVISEIGTKDLSLFPADAKWLKIEPEEK